MESRLLIRRNCDRVSLTNPYFLRYFRSNHDVQPLVDGSHKLRSVMYLLATGSIFINWLVLTNLVIWNLATGIAVVNLSDHFCIHLVINEWTFSSLIGWMQVVTEITLLQVRLAVCRRHEFI